jgi:hypothetical protein
VLRGQRVLVVLQLQPGPVQAIRQTFARALRLHRHFTGHAHEDRGPLIWMPREAGEDDLCARWHSIRCSCFRLRSRASVLGLRRARPEHETRQQRAQQERERGL